MPEASLRAFADHGTIDEFMAADGGSASRTLSSFAERGIDHPKLGEQLQKQGADAFDTSWTSLLATIASQQGQSTKPVR